jgi:hypothetical protein
VFSFHVPLSTAKLNVTPNESKILLSYLVNLYFCISNIVIIMIFSFQNVLYTRIHWFYQETEVPRFQNNRRILVIRLPALSTGRLYTQDIFLELISFGGWVDPRAIVRTEGVCQWKFPTTPSRIEAATFRLVAQCLNQLSHRLTYPLYTNYLKFAAQKVKARRLRHVGNCYP